MAVCIRQAFFELFDGCCPYTELLNQTLARLPDIEAQVKDAMLKDDEVTAEYGGIVQPQSTPSSPSTARTERQTLRPSWSE